MLFCLTTSFCLLAAFPACAADTAGRSSLYAANQFDKSGKTIHFGTQPLATPIGVVEAVLQRDIVLDRALKSKGLTLKFLPFRKGPDVNAFMQRGAIDVTMAGDAPALSIASTGDIVLLALAKQGSSSLVARKPLIALRELKGKRIAYPAGSTADLGLLITLSSVGLTEQSVKLVPMEVTEMASAIISGEIDAFSAFEPTPSLAVSAHAELKIIAKFLNASYVYARRDVLEKHSYAVEQIVAAHVRAVRWLQASDRNLSRAVSWNISDADTFLQRTLGMNPSIIKEITINDLLRFGDPALAEQIASDQGHLRRMFLFMQSRGSIAQNIPWEKVKTSINRGLMKKILSSPKQFKIDTFMYDLR